MRILVASRTREFVPVVKNRWLGLDVRILLVAVAAGNRCMTTGKREVCIFVPGERKGGWFVSLQVVAAFAAIKVRRLGKLSGMLVAVAISAVLELHFEQRVLAFRDVALLALQSGVTSLQGIGRSSVIFNGKFRRLEPIHGVAGGTFDSIAPFRELAVVWIRLMAIHTLLEGQRLLEIASGVAQCAFNRGMLSQQGILGF